jgi:uncharacterized protein
MKKAIYINRKIDSKMQEYIKYPEILAIVGPRQAGKTTYLQNLIKEKGGSFISFEDRETLGIFNNDLKTFYEKYLKNTDLLCIDEFQYSKVGGKNLKYLFDTYKNKKIIISGSSAIDLTIHAIKFLVGRVIVVNFWPFSLEELKEVFPKYSELELYNYYATFGGYPRVAISENNEERKVVLKNIYNTYFLREIKDVLGLVDEYKIQKLLTRLAVSVGSNLNYSKLGESSEIKERDLRKYLEFMNKTFVSYLVRPFYTNKILEIVKQPKAYFYDIGFLSHILNYEVDEGKKLEQVIVMELIKNDCEIKYWRDKNQNEMDFVVFKDNNIIKAIESKIGRYTTRSVKVFQDKYKDVKVEIVNMENLELLNG